MLAKDTSKKNQVMSHPMQLLYPQQLVVIIGIDYVKIMIIGRLISRQKSDQIKSCSLMCPTPK